MSIERLMDTGYEYNYPHCRRCTALGMLAIYNQWVSSIDAPWLLLESAVTRLKTLVQNLC